MGEDWGQALDLASVIDRYRALRTLGAATPVSITKQGTMS